MFCELRIEEGCTLSLQCSVLAAADMFTSTNTYIGMFNTYANMFTSTNTYVRLSTDHHVHINQHVHRHVQHVRRHLSFHINQYVRQTKRRGQTQMHNKACALGPREWM